MTIEPVELTDWKDIRKLWSDEPAISTMRRRLKRMGIKIRRYHPSVNMALFRERSRKMNGEDK